jgi:ATP-binding cassette subfamily F protein 3
VDIRSAQSALAKAEKAVERFTAEVEKLDREILELSGKAAQGGSKMQSLLTARARAGDNLAEAEQVWMAAGTALEEIETA